MGSKRERRPFGWSQLPVHRCLGEDGKWTAEWSMSGL